MSMGVCVIQTQRPRQRSTLSKGDRVRCAHLLRSVVVTGIEVEDVAMKVKVNGIDIHYTIDGERGPWVCLSHSLACHSGMWDEQVTALKQNYRVLCFDTRGHGQSEVPAGPYSFVQMADDVSALLDAVRIERAHFVGLSMGGMIGQSLGLRHPQRLLSLTLANTASRQPVGAEKLWEERIAQARTQGMQALQEGTLSRWFTEAYRTAQPAAMQRIGAMICATPVEGYANCGFAIARINFTDQLKAIRCPTLIVVGEDDPSTPVAMSREIHAAIPGSELVVLQQAAHLSNVEQAAAFNSALLDFLRRAGG
jgi:3-oxoadipate enol-lactonase